MTTMTKKRVWKLSGGVKARRRGAGACRSKGVEAMNHRYKIGDLVYIQVTDPCKRHFETNVVAILGRSYADEYGGGAAERKQFTVCILASSYELTVQELLPKRDKIRYALSRARHPYTVAWYNTSEFTLLAKGTAASELFARRLEDRN